MARRGRFSEVTCATCGEPFRPRRAHARFCSARCRSKAHRDGTFVRCWYCGAPAETIDHVPPRHARLRLAELGLAGRWPQVEVHACRQCNGLLGGRALWTLERRRRFVRSALRLLHRRLLRAPRWSDEELEELGRGLRSSVVEQELARRMVEDRIAWAGARAWSDRTGEPLLVEVGDDRDDEP